jgi:hypothetical protein
MAMAKLPSTAILCLSLLTIACGSPRDDSSRVAFLQGVVRGHEDLTRWSVSFANTTLQSQGVAYRFGDVALGDRGNSSNNPIVIGNYATDFPENVTAVSLRTYYGFTGGVPMAVAPQFQTLHFLRDFEGSVVDSAKTTCLKSRQRIVGATYTALQTAPSQQFVSQFFLGHALHILQDSFAEPHTVRSPDFRTLLNVCTYEFTALGACRHPRLALKEDSVWIGPMCDRAQWNCLKPAAQYAAIAGAGYLKVVGELLAQPVPMDLPAVSAALQPVFDDPNGWNTGYLNCDSLDDHTSTVYLR